jgi:hypothetical protein
LLIRSLFHSDIIADISHALAFPGDITRPVLSVFCVHKTA